MILFVFSNGKFLRELVVLEGGSPLSPGGLLEQGCYLIEGHSLPQGVAIPAYRAGRILGVKLIESRTDEEMVLLSGELLADVCWLVQVGIIVVPQRSITSMDLF